MVEIRVPVERLREVANSLETQSQEADSLLQSALSLVDGLSGEWAGMAQVDYAQMFNDQVPPIRTRFNELLEGLARILRRIADAFEKTDEQAVDGSAAGVAVGAVGGAIGGAVGGSPGGSPGGESGGGSKPPGPASPPEQTPSYQPRYDGSTPAPGMDSTYGKPGQVPLDAPVKSNPGDRSAGLYGDAINQFGVGNNPRYTPDGNYTYCNTFAGDVARAMGVPLPTKAEYGMNPVDRATIGFPQMWDYFTNPNAPVKAADQGWRAVGQNDLATLQSHVNGGKMAVVVNNGHIAVIRPGQDISDFGSIRIAQAGARSGNDISLSEGFGNSATPQIFIID